MVSRRKDTGARQFIETSHDSSQNMDAGWIATYGDLMTLLLCFFMLFFNVRDGESSSEEGKEKSNELKELVAKIEAESSISVVNQVLQEALARSSEITALKTDIQRDLPASEVKKAVMFIERKEKLEIVFPNKKFFVPKTARPLALAEKMFKKIARKINAMKFKVEIEVEGHTDSIPVRTRQFPSNWELSSARAAAVIHILAKYGVNEKRLSSRGLGSTRPALPEHDRRGRVIKKNRAYNRRIILRITKFINRKKRTKRKR